MLRAEVLVRSRLAALAEEEVGGTMGGMRIHVYLLLAAVAVGVAAAPAGASVGARPYGLGLAFIAVADDANATYWNPAGLVQLEGREITLMRNLNAEDEINYQDYLAIAQRLSDKSALGISYVKTVMMRDVGGAGSLWEQKWYWLSYAQMVGRNTSVGVNVRMINDDTSVPGVSIDTDLGLDFAVFHRVDERTTIGLLIQNANEPETKITESAGMYMPMEASLTNVVNWRPGVAYRPNPTVTIALSAYDALDSGNGYTRHLRLGVEKVVRDDEKRYLAFRAGYYGLMADSEALMPKAPTLGVGYGSGNWRVDAALLMGDFDNAFFLSGTVRMR